MKTPSDLLHLAMHHEKMAKELRKQADIAEEHTQFIPDVRLVFAATETCYCGAGLAYDAIQDIDWTCSNILLGIAKDGKHKRDMPHSIYRFEIENGKTTRPKS